jgi:glycosyltransferase involved in cell wall biosynthesis
MIASLVNAWPAEGERAIALFSKTGDALKLVAPDVKVYDLSEEAPLLFKRRGRLRLPGLALRAYAYTRLIRRLKPRTVIGVNQMENLALCMAKRFHGDFRLVVSEHCHVSSNLKGADAHAGFFGWYYRSFFKHEYVRQADVVLTVSHEAASDLVENHGIPKEKVKVIYVPVPVERVRKLADESLNDDWLVPGNRTVVTVCRLEAQKRLDILLKAWALVKRSPEDDPRNPFRLIICGTGSQRAMLERLARELELGDSVRFLGFLDNQFKYEKRAAVFASTSEWEGMPQTLVEAQVLGVPIVSSDCPSGPKELLLDGKAGFLFPSGDVAACARQLVHALTHPEARAEAARVSTEHLGRFDLAAIVREYAAL